MKIGPASAAGGARAWGEGAGEAGVPVPRRAGMGRVGRGFAGRQAGAAAGIPVMAAAAGRTQNDGIPLGPGARPWRELFRRRLGWVEGSARARSRGGECR